MTANDEARPLRDNDRSPPSVRRDDLSERGYLIIGMLVRVAGIRRELCDGDELRIRAIGGNVYRPRSRFRLYCHGRIIAKRFDSGQIL